jgi:glycosyltransferase involved in cell wall biosynthesis
MHSDTSLNAVRPPTISIIVPVWNREHLIVEALASIKGPDTLDWEIVVVDDGSTDGSVEAIRAAFDTFGLQDRARLIEQDNAGPGAARNTAAANARGTWLVCLDSDDFWLPWTVSALLDVLRTNPEAEAGFFSNRNWNPVTPFPDIAGMTPPVSLESQQYDGFFEGHADPEFGVTVSTHNFFCRRSLFAEIGGFQTELRVFEDSDFFLRLPLNCKLLVIRAPLMVIHRNTAESLTANQGDVMDGLAFLHRAEALGEYPGGVGKVRARRIFLARVAQFAITNAWHYGEYAISYSHFLRNAVYLARNRCRLFILRYHKMIASDFWHKIKKLLGV